MVDRQFADARLAALYDPLCGRETRRDFGFYLPLVMSASADLDVGCGTGALLHWARESGHRGRLAGIDPGEGMLAVARSRSDVEWILGDLSSVGFDGEFDLVVMTGHAFQVLVDDDDLRASLTAISEALTGAGRLAFDTRNPLARAWERWTPANGVDFTDADGRAARFEADVERVDGDIVRFTTTYISDAWDEPEISYSTLRFLDAGALGAFLDEAGFEVDEQYGDCDRSTLTDASPEIVTIARPA